MTKIEHWKANTIYGRPERVSMIWKHQDLQLYLQTSTFGATCIDMTAYLNNIDIHFYRCSLFDNTPKKKKHPPQKDRNLMFSSFKESSNAPSQSPTQTFLGIIPKIFIQPEKKNLSSIIAVVL